MSQPSSSGMKPPPLSSNEPRDVDRNLRSESDAGEKSPLSSQESHEAQPFLYHAHAPSRNEFSTRKTAAHALMDVALMMANISQLRTLLSAGTDDNPLFWPLLILIALSILSQIIFAFLVIALWSRNMKGPRRRGSSASGSKLASRREKRLSSVISLKPMRRWNSESFVQPFSVSASMADFLRARKHEQGDDDDDDDDDDGENSVEATNQRLQCATVVVVFFITVFNMFITGLGVAPGHTTHAT